MTYKCTSGKSAVKSCTSLYHVLQTNIREISRIQRLERGRHKASMYCGHIKNANQFLWSQIVSNEVPLSIRDGHVLYCIHIPEMRYGKNWKMDPLSTTLPDTPWAILILSSVLKYLCWLAVFSMAPSEPIPRYLFSLTPSWDMGEWGKEGREGGKKGEW